MKLLIVGCPHSGTMFTAQVLRAAGIACGHEAIYTLHGHAPDVDATAEVSWEGTLHLGTPTIPPGVVIAHQTRDPLAWLNSWLRAGAHPDAWIQLERAYPKIREKHDRDPVRAAMSLWTKMNQRCEQHARFRHRVEDLRGGRGVAILANLGRDAEIDLDTALLRAALASTDQRTNHHPGTARAPSTWASLPRGRTLDKFRSLAGAYGYPSSP